MTFSLHNKMRRLPKKPPTPDAPSSFLRTEHAVCSCHHQTNIYRAPGVHSRTRRRGSGGVTIWRGTWARPVCPWSRWCIQAPGKRWGRSGCPTACRPARCCSAQFEAAAAAEAACRTAKRTSGTNKEQTCSERDFSSRSIVKRATSTCQLVSQSALKPPPKKKQGTKSCKIVTCFQSNPEQFLLWYKVSWIT